MLKGEREREIEEVKDVPEQCTDAMRPDTPPHQYPTVLKNPHTSSHSARESNAGSLGSEPSVTNHCTTESP